ncbi:hypothetical protein AS181_10390 [Gordonia sp. SGD-V-85]|nr:hypothetical protein AS181_10390 [Gordonia sp. SGD-V-85]
MASTRLVDLDALLRRLLGPAAPLLAGSTSGNARGAFGSISAHQGTLHSMNWADGSHHGSPPAHPAPTPAFIDLENNPHDHHLSPRRHHAPS